jgi:tetratricopeptide (TPR) repeat protein
MTLTEAIRRLGDHAELHLNLGLFYAAEEKYAPAGEHLGKAAECDVTCVRAQRALGLVESARGDFYAAARAFQRAWALDPQDLLLAYQLCLAADATHRAGRRVTIDLPVRAYASSSSQIRQLAEYAAAEPDFIEAFLALPPSDADGELFTVVLSVLRTALASHHDYADLHYYTAVALQRLGDADAAGRHLRKAVRINPNYAKALVRLGELSADEGAGAEAVAFFEQAVRSGADWADVHVRLGDLLKAAGKVDSARRHYQKALQLNERYHLAARRLAALAA